MNKITQGFQDFKRGVSVIFGKPSGEGGDRKLAKMAQVVMGQIPMYGKRAVRASLLNSVEKDLKRSYKKGGKEAVHTMIENALATPEYAQLLHKLDLEEPHIRAIAIGIVNRGNKAEVK